MKFNRDSIKHIIACFVVSLAASVMEAACGANYPTSWLAGFIAGMAIGVGKEYGDKCAQGNYWDWWDIAADAIGSFAGASLGSFLTLIIH